MRALVLPAGAEFVFAEEVPALLARAIYPPAEDKGRLSPAVGRVDAEEAHAKEARRAAIRGELPVFDHAGLPTMWGPRARVRVADFIAYAARFDVSVTVAGAKPLHEWTDEEIESARQSGLAAAHVWRVVNESDRAMRILDALSASGEPPARRAERAAQIPAPAPPAESVPAVASKTHQTKRRAEPLAAVLAEAKRQALNPADWQSVWAALVNLAEPASRPPPLLGYAEGEGVKYRSDDAAQPVGFLTREAFRKRFGRMG